MPWVWIGVSCFNLSRVEVVKRTNGEAIEIIMKNGSTLDMSGDDAAAFLREWEEYAGPRVIARAPPRVLRPILIVPDQPEPESVPGRD